MQKQWNDFCCTTCCSIFAQWKPCASWEDWVKINTFLWAPGVLRLLNLHGVIFLIVCCQWRNSRFLKRILEYAAQSECHDFHWLNCELCDNEYDTLKEWSVGLVLHALRKYWAQREYESITGRRYEKTFLFMPLPSWADLWVTSVSENFICIWWQQNEVCGEHSS